MKWGCIYEIKKAPVILATGILAASAMSIHASAGVYYDYVTPSKLSSPVSFSKAWNQKYTFNVNVGGKTVECYGKIGYDTWFQNEDYVKTGWAPTGLGHYMVISNSNGLERTNTVKGGFNTGKADVEHGTNIFYTFYVVS